MYNALYNAIFNIPLMFQTDGYKTGHIVDYPEKTQVVASNKTARGSRIFGQNWTVEFGRQYVLQHLFGEVAQQTFFSRPVGEVVDEYSKFLDTYLNGAGPTTDHVGNLHGLGYIPLAFFGVPEGTRVPLRMPSTLHFNTHDDFGWVTNYFETVIESSTWMAINSATIANRIRGILDATALEQGTDPAFVQWQAHDFSYRGMAGTQAACVSGAAHLLSFTGTDSIPAIKWLEHYYDAEGLIGGSVPATEHSVMCAGGKQDEMETFLRLLENHPTGILSVVSDTWDLWNVLVNILPQIKDKILARDGKLVIRPDSGDPVDIICGTFDGLGGKTPSEKGVMEILWDVFGGTMTPNGLRVLHDHIGVIYGDAITEDRIQQIKARLLAKGFALDMVFGIGSFTYQYQTRDTFAQAMKATYARIDDEEFMLEKSPVTDTGMKKSATGMPQLFQTPSGIEMRDGFTMEQWENATFNGSFGNEFKPLLLPVWRNGEFIRRETLAGIRTRVVGSNMQPVLV